MTQFIFKTGLILITGIFFNLLGQEKQEVEFLLSSQKKKELNYSWKDIPIKVNFTEIGKGKDQEELEKKLKIIIKKVGIQNFKNVEKLHFKVEKKIFLVVYYKSFWVDTRNIKPNLVQEIIFYLNDDNNLIYDFSILEKKILIRINGLYSEMVELKKKISSALKNPSAFIFKNDPDHILNELTKNKGEIEKLNFYLNQFMKTWLAYRNLSFLGKPQPIKEKLKEEVINLKQNNPLITIEEIEKELQEKEIKLKRKEIKLILSLYFQEFKE